MRASAVVNRHGALVVAALRRCCKPSPDHDRTFYGRPVTTREILAGRVRPPTAGVQLRDDMASIG
jgi:hypothetical protein